MEIVSQTVWITWNLQPMSNLKQNYFHLKKILNNNEDKF